MSLLEDEIQKLEAELEDQKDIFYKLGKSCFEVEPILSDAFVNYWYGGPRFLTGERSSDEPKYFFKTEIEALKCAIENNYNILKVIEMSEQLKQILKP